MHVKRSLFLRSPARPRCPARYGSRCRVRVRLHLTCQGGATIGRGYGEGCASGCCEGCAIEQGVARSNHASSRASVGRDRSFAREAEDLDGHATQARAHAPRGRHAPVPPPRSPWGRSSGVLGPSSSWRAFVVPRTRPDPGGAADSHRRVADAAPDQTAALVVLRSSAYSRHLEQSWIRGRACVRVPRMNHSRALRVFAERGSISRARSRSISPACRPGPRSSAARSRHTLSPFEAG